MSDQEIKRIRQEGLCSVLPHDNWNFTLDLGHESEDVWERIVGVVERVVACGDGDWPDDGYWQESLPEWLSSFMMTAEESDAAMARTPREQWGKLSWEFGSWLDAIRERDWKWWGYERSGNKVRLVLEVTGIPPRIDAFKQILLASGAQILSEDRD